MSAFFTYTVPVVSEMTIRREPAPTIYHQANGASSRLEATVMDEEPIGGTHIIATDPASLTPLFSGVILETKQLYRKAIGDPARALAWQITAADKRWLLNRRRPFGSYSDVSASTIVDDLMDTYTSGFTWENLEAALPAVSISFDGTATMSDALTAIAQRLGAGYVWSVDDLDGTPDLHFGLTTGNFEVIDNFSGNIFEVTDHFSGDGVEDTFTLTQPLVPTPGSGALGRGYVTYNNGGGPVNETLSEPAGGGTWEYDSGTNAITRVAGAPVSGTNNIEIIYSTGEDTYTLTYDLVPTPGSGAIGRGYVTYDDGDGPLNETLTSTGGGGVWQYDAGSNAITRTTGIPATGTNNIQIIYTTDSPLNTIEDGDPDLLHDPEPSLSIDYTQIRNRVYVHGIGSPLRGDHTATAVNIQVESGTPFIAGCDVRIGRYVYGVTNVEYSDPPHIDIDPALVEDVASGTTARMWIEVNDTTAQTALAAVEGGDGIHETVLSFTDWTIGPDVFGPDPWDRSDAERTSLTAIADAELAAWADPIETLTFATRNVNVRVGLNVTFDLTMPPIAGTFQIQTVTIDQIAIDAAGTLQPRFTVTAAPYKFTFEDFVRKSVLTDSSGFGVSRNYGGSGGGV